MRDKTTFEKPRRSAADWIRHSAHCVDRILEDLDKRTGYFFAAAENLPPGVAKEICGVAGAEGFRHAIDSIINARRFGDTPRCLAEEVDAALAKHGDVNPWDATRTRSRIA